MDRSILLLVGVLFLSGIFVGFRSLAARTSSETPTKAFSATGVIEEVRYLGLNKGRCQVTIAHYNWLSLSPDFPLQEVPTEGARYLAYAEGELCTATQVAREGARGHVAYRIGEARGRWQLLLKPEPAFGCGGYLSDWQPPPV